MDLNLNGKQIMSIIGAVLSALVVSTAQLTDLFGVGVAKAIVSSAGLGNLVLQSIMTAISGNLTQDAQVKQVLAMRGVERIRINAKATPELAALAVDPTVDKISPTDEDRVTVEATAAASA